MLNSVTVTKSVIELSQNNSIIKIVYYRNFLRKEFEYVRF